jgi:DNA-binding transcriptional regulator/RsmH inhibitor MraZ
MLPRFYQTHLQKQLSANQYILLNLLVELLQEQKQVRLERLAANLALPILFESRRRQLQRFLISPKLTISSIWFVLINYLLRNYFSTSKELAVVIDRTLRAEIKFINGQHYLAAASYPATLAISST